MVIHRFDELLSKLDTLIQDNTERVRADIARNQAQLEILATLQQLIRNNVTARAPNLEPIRTALTQLQQQREPGPRPAYEFTIDRDNRGFMSKITARPQGQTSH
jgi:hypothetical protein